MEINRPLNSLQQVLIDAVLLEAWQLGGWSCFINKMLLASFSGIHTVPSTRVCANLASLGSGGSVGKESACSAGDPGLIPRLGRSAREGIGYPLQYSWAYLVAQLVKNLLAMGKTWVQSLGWKIPWRRERLPTPVFWPGEFHGLHRPWGCKESDTTLCISVEVIGSGTHPVNTKISGCSSPLYKMT